MKAVAVAAARVSQLQRCFGERKAGGRRPEVMEGQKTWRLEVAAGEDDGGGGGCSKTEG